eukprot:6172711-Pleurochrysis_carterae.AAC.4
MSTTEEDVQKASINPTSSISNATFLCQAATHGSNMNIRGVSAVRDTCAISGASESSQRRHCCSNRPKEARRSRKTGTLAASALQAAQTDAESHGMRTVGGASLLGPTSNCSAASLNSPVACCILTCIRLCATQNAEPFERTGTASSNLQLA